MAYLTYDEYKTLSPSPVNETEFDSLVKRAEAVIDGVTGRFYRGRDFESDFEWRREAVQEAVAAQVDYFAEAGGSTHLSLRRQPQSVVLGRTHITRQHRMEDSKAEQKESIVCFEAYNALWGTGLLFRVAHHD